MAEESISIEDFNKAKKALEEANLKEDEKLYLHHTGRLIATGPRGTRFIGEIIE